MPESGQGQTGAPIPSPFDEVAWASVDLRFRRALQTFAIRLGLSDNDAEDVAQESLAALAAGVRAGRVTPGVSDLGSYLFGIARKQVALVLRRRYGAPGMALSVTDTWIDTMPETAREREIWEQTWAVSNLTQCLEVLRAQSDPAKFRMFLLRFRARRGVEEIARQEGVDAIAVYRAVHELKQRLRQMLKGVARDPATT